LFFLPDNTQFEATETYFDFGIEFASFADYSKKFDDSYFKVDYYWYEDEEEISTVPCYNENG
jgi:hypothetical protein